MSKPIELVTLQRAEIVALINSAVGTALADQQKRQAADCSALSLNGAARLARRRREFVASALESGALPGKRYGNSKTAPRWSIIAADVRDWLSRGCPVEA